ncbi:MAG: ECF-type sigma factor [Planctomycetota bacterium]
MPPSDGQSDVTLLLNTAADGDTAAAEQLLPVVYDQLRRAAQQRMASERVDHTLSATALVHEAYLKLVGPRQIPWAGRGHFYAAAAQAMRRILIDHARSRAARGGEALRLEDIEDVGMLATADSSQIMAVDAAVARLESDDPEAAAVVRLRFFAGLSVEQAAEALGISPRTAARLWAFARAVLYRELTEHDNEGTA